MQSLICREFDHFVEALSGLQGRYVIKGPQLREWRLQILDLDGACVMLGEEGAGRVYNGLANKRCFHIFFLLEGAGQVIVDGRSFDLGDVAWISPNSDFHTCTHEPIRWLNVSLDVELVRDWARSHEDQLPDHLFELSLVKRAASPSSDLLSLIDCLTRSDAQGQDAAIRRAARNALLDATLRTVLPLSDASGGTDRCGQRRRVVDRALERLDSLAEQPVDISALCAASGASERALRNAFHAYFGLGPQQYLMLHRLHVVRDHIRMAGPEDTVTGLCSRFGIWDFGRFARAYRERFGILPSQHMYRHRDPRAPASGRN